MRRINSSVTLGVAALTTALGLSGCYPYMNDVTRTSDSVGKAGVATGASRNTINNHPTVSKNATLSVSSSTQPGASGITSEISTETNTETDNGTSGTNQPKNSVSVDTTEGPPPAASSNKPQYPQKATEMLVPEVYHAAPGTVELTIDDGPSPYTASIIQTLAKYHDHTTFFFVGRNVERFPSAVQLALQNGDGIGIHTMNHPEMTNLSKAQQQSEIEQAAAVIHRYDPYPLTLYRPPYGLWNNFTEEIMKQDNLSLALWDADPRDWAAKSPTDVVNAVLNSHPSGKVFDLHDTELTLQALPAILQGLQKQHLQVVGMRAPSSVTGIAGIANSTKTSSPTNTSGTRNSVKTADATHTAGSSNAAKASNSTNGAGSANNSVKDSSPTNTVGASNSVKNSSQNDNHSEQTNNNAVNTASN